MRCEEWTEAWNKVITDNKLNETIAKELREVSKTLNGVVVSPLEEELLK